MVSTYEEYIKLLESELKAHNFIPLNESEISAFIRKHQIDKYQGIVVKDVQSDIRTLTNLHSQGKSAYSETQNYTTSSTNPGFAVPHRSNPRLAKNQMIGMSGKTYTLEGKPFSSGGEGDIFKIIGDSSLVIKIYHPDRITSELEHKLQFMANNPPASSVLNQVAWPMDVVYDEYKQFKGFVMPKLDITAELGSVYVYPPSKPESRIAYNYKLILAMNICTVIHAVHNAGYIFGDFNPRNIGINMKTGKVAFLDTDSYHIVINERKNKAYRCKVCLDGYVAPELLKQCEPYKNDAYENAPLPTFTRETDNFALAIHIFKLLMNGYTPFNGIKENETASTSSPGIGNQAIKRDSYCFKMGNKPQAAAVPSAKILPNKIKKCFDRAFIDGKNNPKKRPDAQEWYSALSEYEKTLVICPKYPAHMYKRGLTTCPWCDADERYHQSINAPITQRTFLGPPVAPIATPVYTPSSSSGVVRAPATSQAATTSSYVQPATPTKAKLSGHNKVEKAGSILYPISWIVFLANVCFCLAPFVSNGSISFDNSILYGMDYRLYSATSLISIFLLCFSDGLKSASALGTVFSWIWSFICCFGIATIRYTQMGFNSASASRTWKIFGILLVTFIAALIISSKLGNRIRTGANTRSQSRKKQKFRSFDIIFLVLLIGASAFCIPLLLNLSQFYWYASTYNLFAIAIWVVPIIFFIMFASAWSGNEVVGSWFCATMAVLFECIVLRLATMESALAIILWLVLACVALGLIFYMQTEMENVVSAVTVVSFFIFFIVGAFTDLKILGSGVSAVGEGAHWWTVAPAIIDVGVTAAFSVVEIFRK